MMHAAKIKDARSISSQQETAVNISNKLRMLARGSFSQLFKHRASDADHAQICSRRQVQRDRLFLRARVPEKFDRAFLDAAAFAIHVLIWANQIEAIYPNRPRIV